MMMNTTSATPSCSCLPTPSWRPPSSWWPCRAESPWTFSQLFSKSDLLPNPTFWLTIPSTTSGSELWRDRAFSRQHGWTCILVACPLVASGSREVSPPAVWAAHRCSSARCLGLETLTPGPHAPGVRLAARRVPSWLTLSDPFFFCVSTICAPRAHLAWKSMGGGRRRADRPCFAAWCCRFATSFFGVVQVPHWVGGGREGAFLRIKEPQPYCWIQWYNPINNIQCTTQKTQQRRQRRQRRPMPCELMATCYGWPRLARSERLHLPEDSRQASVRHPLASRSACCVRTDCGRKHKEPRWPAPHGLMAWTLLRGSRTARSEQWNFPEHSREQASMRDRFACRATFYTCLLDQLVDGSRGSNGGQRLTIWFLLCLVEGATSLTRSFVWCYFSLSLFWAVLLSCSSSVDGAAFPPCFCAVMFLLPVLRCPHISCGFCCLSSCLLHFLGGGARPLLGVAGLPLPLWVDKHQLGFTHVVSTPPPNWNLNFHHLDLT